MEFTTRELNQQTERILARAETGETINVTNNALPIATDPLGRVDCVPTFCGSPDLSERVDELLAGFGSDDG
jgi:hypothetical protein